MPRNQEPSFSMKLIIWDVAATAGTDNYSAVYREIEHRVEQLHRQDELFGEEIPSERTVRRIIDLDIQNLTPDVVVVKLQPHIWRLRHDYEAIKQLAEDRKIQQRSPRKVIEGSPVSVFDIHFRALAEVAKTLHDVQDFIRSYGQDEKFTVIEHKGMEGFFTFQPLPTKYHIFPSFSPTGSVVLEYPDVKYFFEHLNQEYPELGLKSWKEMITNKKSLPQDVIDRIRYLGNTARFVYCPSCQVCNDINT